MEFEPNILIEKRRMKRLSQQEVANFIGVSQVSYNKYEKGLMVPKIDKINKLNQILELEIIPNGINTFTSFSTEPNSLKKIPLYNVKAKAGLGTNNLSEDVLRYISDEQLKGCIGSILVDGDSIATKALCECLFYWFFKKCVQICVPKEFFNYI